MGIIGILSYPKSQYFDVYVDSKTLHISNLYEFKVSLFVLKAIIKKKKKNNGLSKRDSTLEEH